MKIRDVPFCVPMMFGAADERPRAAGGQHFYPVERYGVKLISMGRWAFS